MVREKEKERESERERGRDRTRDRGVMVEDLYSMTCENMKLKGNGKVFKLPMSTGV
jgi:hypothetical protein